ncbi:DUF5977 domain-containing protein [Chitinophaga sp. sic0106]|uniref:DUF5977 domain-containing protein n=1 Tax=Chitinophaga sp. sic0106 TaxID=2854785 RepID=UPI001C442A23|nr:DUF5977 domain-containing protein [Chitinophaga sp. sic0106]MBV7531174.1 hypothetical protein [Chitinophaga sp. sic0106]
MNLGKLNIPISLNYHAGGIKVEDIASWVGLGWALNTGGIINRQTRGLPDEEVGGYRTSYALVYKHMDGRMKDDEARLYFSNITTGTQDAEPDLFSYSTASGSGQFYFDTTGHFQTIPADGTRVEMTADKSFVITDTQGYQYWYTKKELTITELVMDNTLGDQNTSTTTWYLTSIVNPLRTDSITYEYDPTTLSNRANAGDTKYLNEEDNDPKCDPKLYTHTESRSQIRGWRLKKINFSEGFISFNEQAEYRKDYTSDKALASIEIKSNDGVYYKQYVLRQTAVMSSGYSGGAASTAPFYRQYLDSIEIISKAGKEASYVFDYTNRETLPHRFSNAQDYWGFYNGKTENTSLIPTVYYTNPFTGAVLIEKGADRAVDAVAALAGTLKSIKYPTGGKTVFEMENNTSYTNNPYMRKIIGSGYFIIPVSLDPASQRKWDTTFTVTAPTTLSATVVVPERCKNPAIGCPVTKICGPEGGCGTLSSGNFQVKAGTYRVTVDLTMDVPEDLIRNYRCNLSWLIYASTSDSVKVNAPVGGLRVKRIYDTDGMENIVNDRYYTYVDGSGDISSGLIQTFPIYNGSIARQKIFQEGTGNNGSPFYYETYCKYRIFSSFSSVAMLSTQGAPVGYKYVQEYYGPKGVNGKKELTFTASDEYPDLINPNYPYPPPTSHDWQRGNLLEEKTFKYNAEANKFEIVKDKVNRYELSESISVVQGMKLTQGLTDYLGDDAWIPGSYEVSYYNTESGWFPLIKSETTTFDTDKPENHLQESVFYSYDDAGVTFQPVTVKRLRSGGDSYITNYKFPGHFNTPQPAGKLAEAMKLLLQLNIVDNPIETTIQIQKNGEQAIKTLMSTFTSYKSNLPLPDTTWTTEFGKPVADFVPAYFNTAGELLIDKAYRPQLVTSKYNSYGNIIEQLEVNNAPEAYLWAYKNKWPVAKVVNGNYSQISSLVDIGALEASSDDTYIRQELNKLRNGTANSLALMSTYSYLPMIGKSSETDPAGKTTYYEYDNMQRLQAIRDQHQKILKLYCYNYAGQPGLCNGLLVGNALRSQAFTKQCEPGYTGSSVVYTVPANKWVASTQKAADSLADIEIQTKGQAYANEKGICDPPGPYVRLRYVNQTSNGAYVYADVVVDFYADKAKTIPMNVSNLVVNYRRFRQRCDLSTTNTTNFSKVCTGTSFVLERTAELNGDPNEAGLCWLTEYSLLAGTGYTL